MVIVPPAWAEVFAPHTALLELVARGTVLYFGVLVLVRLLPRRTGGELATMDLVFILLIAEAAAHAFGNYTSIADGFVVIATLVFWDFAVNFVSYHVPAIERLTSAPPLQVIANGRMLKRNMRKEYLTEEELMSHLRSAGIERVEDVKSAKVEGDGQISVVPRK